jgi:sugar fermentation stimulation protein A
MSAQEEMQIVLDNTIIAAQYFISIDLSERSWCGTSMKFDETLLEGQFKKRYKRFFADIKRNGEILTAHVPNTGSMLGCNIAESPCLISRAKNPQRKLQYTLEMMKSPESWIGVNTSRSNQLAWELWESRLFAPWADFEFAQQEVKINSQTRIDLALWKAHPTEKWTPRRRINLESSAQKFHFVEVKNVSLAENGVALFPDTVTERGQKHLAELMELLDQGHSAELLFTVQRQDCHSFSPADSIDPKYGKLLRQAKARGLRVTALPCYLSEIELRLLPTPLTLISC